MDYIKREDAFSDVMCEGVCCQECPFLINPAYFGCKIENYIKSIPAADVVERKVGKWIKVSDVSRFLPGNAEYRCSVCLANEEHAESADVPYCWHCGAKMEE